MIPDKKTSRAAIRFAHRFSAATLLYVLLSAQPVQAVEGYDRQNHRRIEVLSLVGGDSLQAGSLLELALEDTQEVIVGEVLRIRRIGHDLELEILDRSANQHFFFELPADGVSDIHR